MRTATWKLTGFALASSLALPFAAARAGDVVVPEDAVVAAAAKAEQSTVVLRITRPTSGHTWLTSYAGTRRAAELAREKARAAPAPVAVPPSETKPVDYTHGDQTSYADIRLQLQSWGGSGVTRARGFFVGDGHAVLTAAIAVDGASKIEILREGGAVEAVVAGLDRDFDVAVLRTSATGPALEIDAAAELEPGRVVILAGDAGIDVRYVSARGGVTPRRGYGMLATSLPSANVGAPAVGPDGRLRGLVAAHAGLSDTVQTQGCAACHTSGFDAWSRPMVSFDWHRSSVTLPTQAVGPNLRRDDASPAVAHLVPGRRVARAVKDLLADGRVRKAYLGVVLDRPKEATGDARRVAQVLPGSPAEGMLLAGDRILAVGGRELSAADDVTYEILALEPNRPARIVVERAGGPARVDVAVTPTERKEDASTRGPLVFGFDVVTLTPELRLWTARGEGEGLLIASVTVGGAAERAGFARGDRVLRLAGRAVVTQADLAGAVDDALRGLAAGQAVVLDVERDGKEVSHALHAATPATTRPAPR